MNTALESLLKNPRLWRGERPSWQDADAVASGFAALDTQLPGGGWPSGALTEILLPNPGIGELRLLLPALTRLNHDKQWIALIGPPFIPYAPAWQASGLDLSRLLWVHPRSACDHLWAAEQALRAGTCAAVLSWPPAQATFKQLRRLQLAAETGRSWGVLFRPLAQGTQASPAALRVRLTPDDNKLSVHLLKRRGSWGGEAVQLSLPLFRIVK